jgi:hypothetical protein
MSQKRPSKSVRKYLRQEKAKIHRGVLDLSENQRLINELYEKFGIKKKLPKQ